MKEYLPHIDGLRGLAVLMVVLFHAFPRALPGGFLGVDIFFVISGYLITSIIVTDVQNGEFNLFKFLGNRIRRILPAFILVALTCLAVGFFSLFIQEYEQLGHHVATASLFVINLVLKNEINYFGNQAETTPMLHLWSLSVEEQFYLFWPLAILAIYAVGAKLRYWTVALFLLGWATSLLLATIDFSLNFYHPFGRAWELLLGAVLSVWLRPNQRQSFQKKVNLQSQNQSLVWAQTRPELVSSFGVGLIILGLYLPHNFTGIAWYLKSSTTFLMVPLIGVGLVIASESGHFLTE